MSLFPKNIGLPNVQDGKIDKNISSRIGKLIGTTALIMNLLRELSLGHFYIPMALTFRQTIFLPVMLLNSESWFNLTKKNIEDLELMDRDLLRKILNCPSKTPTPALYLELGCLPIKYLIIYKRLMYLHHILNLSSDHLLSQVFSAQLNNPSKGDWCLQAKEDLKTLGFDFLEFDDLKTIKSSKFKKMVKKACAKSAFEYLCEERGSKTSGLKYSELKIQGYLKSENLSTKEKQLIFPLRTRMIPVSHNFGNKTKQCPLCLMGPDSQQHILECFIIRGSNKNIIFNTEAPQYNDIFSKDETKLKQISKIFSLALRTKEVMTA